MKRRALPDVLRACGAGVAVLTMLLAMAPVARAAAPAASPAATSVPVLAYYYIWFDTTSWNRAKTDLPLLGPYSSDDAAVMRTHIRWAKAAGIDGFIVSWKNTPTLTARLDELVKIADEENFKLAIIYQGLDFWRAPLPVAQIGADLDFFAKRYGQDPAFDLYAHPLVIWSGTWMFTRPQIERVTATRRQNLLILASQKQPSAYEHIADLVDGNAYYWSSVDPDTHPDYLGKLQAMAEAVHDSDGLWIAPAAPGFDARLIGGERTIDRKDGQTLTTEMKTALQSKPDAIGLISWNEFSENSQIEPSCTYGSASIDQVAQLLGGTAPDIHLACDQQALANAVAASASSPAATPPVDVAAGANTGSGFDWDSSAPGTNRSDFGGLAAFAMLLGIIGFSFVHIARHRVIHSEAREGAPATGSRGGQRE